MCDVVRLSGERFFAEAFCIERTQLVSLVCAKFGLAVEPIEVATVVSNAAGVHDLGCPNPLPRYDGQFPVSQIAGFGPPTRSHPAGKFCGHLVALVEKTYLVDISVAQFRNRRLGISTPDVTLLHAPQLSEESGQFAGIVVSEAGPASVLVYHRRPLCLNLDDCPGWDATHLHEPSRRIANLIRNRVAKGLGPFTEIRSGLQEDLLHTNPNWQREVACGLIATAFEEVDAAILGGRLEIAERVHSIPLRLSA